jgi:hypothetical protein
MLDGPSQPAGGTPPDPRSEPLATIRRPAHRRGGGPGSAPGWCRRSAPSQDHNRRCSLAPDHVNEALLRVSPCSASTTLIKSSTSRSTNSRQITVHVTDDCLSGTAHHHPPAISNTRHRSAPESSHPTRRRIPDGSHYAALRSTRIFPRRAMHQVAVRRKGSSELVPTARN